MKLALLKNLANHFKSYQTINHLKRIQDNLFKLELHQEIFYLDLQKYQSNIFMSPNPLGDKNYQAPFDLMLKQLTTKAKILDCYCDGNNRILIFHCRQNHPYKIKDFFIHFEFTGKYTNVILLDDQSYILEALRHLNHDKSSRIIQPNHLLTPLFQKHHSYIPIVYNKTQLYDILQKNYHHIMHQKLLQKKQKILQRLQKKLQKHQELLSHLPKAEVLEQQSKQLAQHATLLLANLHLIEPFKKQITLLDFDQKFITITLPQIHHSPQEGINAMFSQGKKYAKKAKNIHLEQQNLNEKIAFIHQEILFVKKTQNLDDLDLFEQKKPSKKLSQKFEHFFIEGYKISLGKNAHENQILLQSAKANDIWLHIKDIPSAHMIIHCGKNKPAQSIIQRAAIILVELNPIASGNFIVDYTLRKFVKIKEKANVVYTKYQSINYKK